MWLVLPPSGWCSNFEVWHHYPDISFLLIFYPESKFEICFCLWPLLSLVLHFGRLPFWSSSILVVFHFVRLAFCSSSILVVFYFGRLLFLSSSIWWIRIKYPQSRIFYIEKFKIKRPQSWICQVTGAATTRMVAKIWTMAPLSRYLLFINILPRVVFYFCRLPFDG